MWNTRRCENYASSAKSSSSVSSSHQQHLINAYGQWMRGLIDEGWEGYLLTFEFRTLSGSLPARIAQMERDLQFWYGRLLTRMFRHPRSQDSAPILPRVVLAPDLARYKRRWTGDARNAPNGGLHYHAIAMARRTRRIMCPLDAHIREKEAAYLVGRICHIDARPIDHSVEYVTDYAMKTAKASPYIGDHIMILPRGEEESVFYGNRYMAVRGNENAPDVRPSSRVIRRD